MFDPEREADALARRDELTIAAPPENPLGNAAWRAIRASNRAWRERRWDDVVAAYRPDYELDGSPLGDGRRPARRRLPAQPAADLRHAGERWHTELLATRGEHHALIRARLVAELPDRGRVEWEHLGVTEFDAQGRRKSIVLFDTERLDVAYAELDARYAAGEGAPHAAARDAR